MKCECGQEVTGKGKHCSARCKQRAYRNRTVTDEPVGVTVTPGNVVTVTAHRQRCTDPDTQAIWDRRDKQRRGKAWPYNLSLPGQPDYDGVCVKDKEGAWRACG